jgi:zinc/manganese transport system ATP-binding protein
MNWLTTQSPPATIAASGASTSPSGHGPGHTPGHTPGQAPAGAPDEGLGPVVEFAGAAVRVGGRRLWSGVDVVIGAGEFVAVLGPNGVGKSTMVKAILGAVPLAAGSLRVAGRRPGAANDQIGYLPQRRSFDPQLRIRGVDVVRLGLDGARWGLPLPGAGRLSARARADRARVQEVIALVDATGYAHRPIGQLSGGEQQRLLIAQALVSRPRLLLLDEPLDSLDLPNQSGVAALISRICRTEQVTVVMVAHDVNPILGYLDRVVYIASGGAAAGPPREVITGETLTRLYGTPVEVLSTSDGRLVVVGQPEAPAHHSDRHQP